LLAQLAASDEWTGIYADALAATSAKSGVTGTATAPARPARWFSRPRARQFIGAAASLTIVGALSLWWAAQQRRQGDPIGSVVAQLSTPDAGLPPGWNERAWSVVRGSVAPLTPSARAARIGALSVDLDLALGANDTASSVLAREIGRLLQYVPGSAPAALLYEELARATAAPDGRTSGLHEDALRSAAAILDSSFLALGAWAEAAHVAGLRRDAAFFREDPEREATFPPQHQADVGRIRTLAGEPTVDWEGLVLAIRQLLAAASG
jgi:hypothetical protein